MSFTIFYIKKTPFQAIKRRSSKSRKTDMFPKRLTNGFGRKMGIYPSFFGGGNKGQKNVFYDILKRKIAFLGYKNKKFKKSENLHFSKGVNPWFSSKNSHFLTFFLSNIGQENVFYDIVERKKAFRGYKNKNFKKSKN